MMTHPDETSTPEYFIGVCGWCTSIMAFNTDTERRRWEEHHPHDEGN